MYATAGSVGVRRTLARIAIAALILVGMITGAGQGSAQSPPEPVAAPNTVGWYYPQITPFDPVPLYPWYGWNPGYRPYYSWYPYYLPGLFGSS
ncbi:hypothetical protein AB0L57_10830 [Nocardia sp. NPDC052254]|uniref:hypothetical protein n=1 Tax=Nocardia sp. NPDC052254 TaxID=3155681 RepID=UPI00343ABFDD